MNHPHSSHPSAQPAVTTPAHVASSRSLLECNLAAQQEAVQAALQRAQQALAQAHEAVHAAVAMAGRQRLQGWQATAPAPEPAAHATHEDMSPHDADPGADADADAAEHAVRAAAQAQEQAQRAAQAQAEAAVAAAQAGLK